MNPETGTFVTGDDIKPGMARYKVGETIEIRGNRYEVLSFQNVDRDGVTRGQLILRALSTDDRALELDAKKNLSDFLQGDNPNRVANRKERRHRERAYKKKLKRVQKKNSKAVKR